mmetsp:Transcript_4844/g.14708  ORF Transcript_4844/g.14708 Transcript_4844/m.14708 type:complete len:387 (+) Transcript_4844:227-1387(+)
MEGTAVAPRAGSMVHGSWRGSFTTLPRAASSIADPLRGTLLRSHMRQQSITGPNSPAAAARLSSGVRFATSSTPPSPTPPSPAMHAGDWHSMSPAPQPVAEAAENDNHAPDAHRGASVPPSELPGSTPADSSGQAQGALFVSTRPLEENAAERQPPELAAQVSLGSSNLLFVRNKESHWHGGATQDDSEGSSGDEAAPHTRRRRGMFGGGPHASSHMASLRLKSFSTQINAAGSTMKDLRTMRRGSATVARAAAAAAAASAVAGADDRAIQAAAEEAALSAQEALESRQATSTVTMKRAADKSHIMWASTWPLLIDGAILVVMVVEVWYLYAYTGASAVALDQATVTSPVYDADGWAPARFFMLRKQVGAITCACCLRLTDVVASF